MVVIWKNIEDELVSEPVHEVCIQGAETKKVIYSLMEEENLVRMVAGAGIEFSGRRSGSEGQVWQQNQD